MHLFFKDDFTALRSDQKSWSLIYLKHNLGLLEIIDDGIGREKANKLKLKSAQKNKSMGMQITRDRMAISNILSNDQIDVEITDLYTEKGSPCGTKVEVKLLLSKLSS